MYAGRIGVYYDRVHRHRKIAVDASDVIWVININVPSLRGVLVLFEVLPAPFARDPEYFYNPEITKIEFTVEGVPNQLFSAGMRPSHQWEEARKFFAGGSKRDPTVAAVCKELCLSGMRINNYLTNHYALWLDLRTSDDDNLHGSGLQILNASEGLTLQIQKESQAKQPLRAVVYLVQDAQFILEGGQYSAAIY